MRLIDQLHQIELIKIIVRAFILGGGKVVEGRGRERTDKQ